MKSAGQEPNVGQQDAFDMYGRLKEGVHIAGYTFERACTHLEWLLDGDRWKLGDRFENVDRFLDSVKLDQFRIMTDQRKRIAQRIKELQPEASNRAIARVVGVKETTVRRDLATNVAPANKKSNDSSVSEGVAATNVAPAIPSTADLGGASVAKMVEARAVKEQKAEAKKAERIGNSERIAAANTSLPVGERKYGTIYADPPWTFQVWSGEGKDRAAENHYPTQSQAEIEAWPVADMAADDCALFMWAVMPQLQEALDVIKAWGFEYKTCAFVWVKQTKDEERFATGMGYWTRANAEVCLLATRGSPVRLNADVHQVVMSPRLEHSEKPEEVRRRIERLVSGPYVELFARRRVDGWEPWGNEVDADVDGEIRPLAVAL